MSVSINVERILSIVLIGWLVTGTESIDPEYSLENRIETFFAATLNSILSVAKLDERPIDEDVTFWCAYRLVEQ